MRFFQGFVVGSIFFAAMSQAYNWMPTKPKAKGYAADGYYFEEKEYVKDTMTVEMVVAENRAEWTRFVRAKVGDDAEPRLLGAFAALQQDENSCTIYARDPEWLYEPEFIGHELLHCFYGDFHKKQTKQRSFLQ